ncbi:NAD-dependent epimerase/dehydratase family protein [Streptomyces asoensis]
MSSATGGRVVVTGATGNAGTSVVRLLSEDPDVVSVHGLARRIPDLSPPKTEWTAVDLASGRTDLAPVFAGADAVVHLAWALRPTHDPATTWRTNFLGSIRVFEAVAAARVPVLVHASSVGAYYWAGSRGTPLRRSWRSSCWACAPEPAKRRSPSAAAASADRPAVGRARGRRTQDLTAAGPTGGRPTDGRALGTEPAPVGSAPVGPAVDGPGTHPVGPAQGGLLRRTARRARGRRTGRCRRGGRPAGRCPTRRCRGRRCRGRPGCPRGPGRSARCPGRPRGPRLRRPAGPAGRAGSARRSHRGLRSAVRPRGPPITPPRRAGRGRHPGRRSSGCAGEYLDGDRRNVPARSGRRRATPGPGRHGFASERGSGGVPRRGAARGSAVPWMWGRCPTGSRGPRCGAGRGEAGSRPDREGGDVGAGPVRESAVEG